MLRGALVMRWPLLFRPILNGPSRQIAGNPRQQIKAPLGQAFARCRARLQEGVRRSGRAQGRALGRQRLAVPTRGNRLQINKPPERMAGLRHITTHGSTGFLSAGPSLVRYASHAGKSH